MHDVEIYETAQRLEDLREWQSRAGGPGERAKVEGWADATERRLHELLEEASDMRALHYDEDLPGYRPIGRRAKIAHLQSQVARLQARVEAREALILHQRATIRRLQEIIAKNSMALAG